MINVVYASWGKTGETAETFVLLVEQLHVFSFRRHILSIKHRVIMVLMWFRCYSTCHMFSALLSALKPLTILLMKVTAKSMYNKDNISPVTPLYSYTGEC